MKGFDAFRVLGEGVNLFVAFLRETIILEVVDAVVGIIDPRLKVACVAEVRFGGVDTCHQEVLFKVFAAHSARHEHHPSPEEARQRFGRDDALRETKS